jgi:simple sugar transport system ATP-binding protein
MRTLDGAAGGASATATAAPALRCRAVTVRFGDFTAVRDVSASWEAGTINVVVGQNGAGKSTLARVLGGMTTPDAGEVAVAGAVLRSGRVSDARRHGVELVHQHFALPADFTVAQALELFASGASPVFSRSGLRERAAEALAATGGSADPDALVGTLPVETVQSLEISRALASRPRVLILDEPTAVLPPPHVEALFRRLRGLAASGICVLLVLHKLAEVFEVADTVAALRDGELVLPPTPAGEIDRRTLAGLIIGNRPPAAQEAPAPVPADAPAVLSVRGLAAATAGHDARLCPTSFSVAAGEVVGVAGVEGNGQRSLVEALVGIAPAAAGRVELAGVDVTGRDVRSRRAAGMRTIPFDRNTEGVSPTSALWENHAALAAPGEGWWLSRRVLRERCREALQRWNVSFRSEQQPAGDLSGGNVQKTILARELSGEPVFVVAAHPTRGLDLGATAFVRTALTEAAAEGTGVLLVSADLDELFDLSHRLLVMYGGEVVAQFRRPFDRAEVGWAMTGGEGS